MEGGVKEVEEEEGGGGLVGVDVEGDTEAGEGGSEVHEPMA